jgi:cell division protein ZapA (FtsZ GTPase activity inhibitor)
VTESVSPQAMEAVKVQLFGREYSVRGHGNTRYVQTLAEFIGERAAEIQRQTRVVTTIDLVILTLLNVTDELFQNKQLKDKSMRELEEKAEKILRAIDRVV